MCLFTSLKPVPRYRRLTDGSACGGRGGFDSGCSPGEHCFSRGRWGQARSPCILWTFSSVVSRPLEFMYSVTNRESYFFRPASRVMMSW